MADLLTQYASQRQNFFPGVAPRNSQLLNGVPGMNGPLGMVAQMILQPYISQLMGNMGMVPGQFMPMQNLVDLSRERSFFQQHMGSLQVASQADKETYIRMMRGVANLSGTKFGAEQYAAARSIAGGISTMAPMMAMMMPDLFDEMHGPRGSNVVMTHHMNMANRYARDPFTGSTGYSAKSADLMARTIHRQLYGESADLAAMHGLGAGRTGAMYDELLRRGFMGGLDREATIQNMLGGNKEPGARERLLNDPGFGDKLRGFEANRVSTKLKEMSGVVAAMRDIFGDLGRPNAPMSELINGLQALTQGGMSTMSPAKLEMTARQLNNVARSTGMGMNVMSQFMSMAATQADAFGLDRQYAVGATMGAAAFGHAFGQVGKGDVAAFGRKDKEALTAMDMQLRMRAAASPIANQLNTVMRLRDELGIKADSELGKLAEAIENGQTATKDGKSIVMSQNELKEIAMRSGVSESTFNSILSRRQSNQEYGVKYNTGDLTRNIQKITDINPFVRNAAVTALSGAFRNLDQKTLASLAGAATDTLNKMDVSVRADATKRRDAIAEGLWNSLSADQKQKFGSKEAFNAAAVDIWATLDERVRSTPSMRGYGSAHNLFDLHNSLTLGEAAKFKSEQEGEARLQSALSGLGRDSPLRRAMGALEEAGPDAKLDEILGKAFGGVPSKEVLDKIGPLMQNLRAEQTKFNDVKGSPEQKKAAREAIARRMEELVRNIRGISDKEGFILDMPVKQKEVGEALEAESDFRSALAKGDVAGANKGADLFMRRSDRIADTMLFSEGAMAMLGHSGIDRVVGIQKRNAELRKMAKDKGISIEQLIRGEGVDGNTKKHIDEIMQQNRSDMEFIRDRVKGGKKATGADELTDKDRRRIIKLREEFADAHEKQQQDNGKGSPNQMKILIDGVVKLIGDHVHFNNTPATGHTPVQGGKENA